MEEKEGDFEQLDLFGSEDLNPAKPLNGVYYEESTCKYVSFVVGRRHYEWSAKKCSFDKEWQEKTKRERAI
ncbi:hypothetical protein [Paenibacillus crassostreae]|uniref:hypothetical protein n=1 Tax=Paenibacillus crassostreae TaxID=1763538 RepID=UPI000B10EA57|nr:hypothetical protein [Paenibacillus crassostreae]